MHWRVLVARKQRDWSQTELGEKVGLPRAEIGRIEQGWTPPLDVQTKLAEVLDAPIDYLFDATATP